MITLPGEFASMLARELHSRAGDKRVVPHSLNETDMVGEVDSDRSWTEDCLMKSGVKPRKEWGTGVQLPRQRGE